MAGPLDHEDIPRWLALLRRVFPGEPITITNAVVQLVYPRHWWQLWRPGWHRHVDGFGRPCWIRYCWPSQEGAE